MGEVALGPFEFRWNGILILIGFAAGAALTWFELRRRGADARLLGDLIIPILAWGTVGARLWHVFTPALSAVSLGLTTRHYLTHPLDLAAIWIGGFGLPGALAGGAVGLGLFCRLRGEDPRQWLDAMAPGLALGQAVGRLGNYFNQELYGLPTDLPWKIFIDPDHRLPGFEAFHGYHPLFAYDAILSLVNLGLLLVLSRRVSPPLAAGNLFLVYLFNFCLVRFALEFMKLDASLVNGVNINQAVMAVLAPAAAAGFFLRQRSVQKL